MVGFWKLRSKIEKLDYIAFSKVMMLVQELQQYIGQAKSRGDHIALDEARDIIDAWEAAINKIPLDAKLEYIKKFNRSRTIPVLKRLRLAL